MSKTTLAFEIGTEELPAFDLHAATEQLPSLVATALGSVRVPFDDVKVYSSPRRLVAIVEGVPERTEASVEEFRGPAARIAFDAEGNPTKAAAGFARGKGVDVADLERRDEDGAEYVYAVKNTPSADVAELLPETLKGVIEGLPMGHDERVLLPSCPLDRRFAGRQGHSRAFRGARGRQ